MFSDGDLYSFERAIVVGRLRLALRIVIGLQAVVSKFASLFWPTFSLQCLSLKRRAVVGRDSMFDGEEERFCQGIRDVLRGESPRFLCCRRFLFATNFEMHTPKT